MKLPCFAILFLVIACQRENHSGEYLKNQKDTMSSSSQKVTKNVKETLRDTTYRIGSFLICCSNAIKIDILNKNDHTKPRTGKGDTLCDYGDTIMLGDNKGMNISDTSNASSYICMGLSGKEGIYKKCELKYKFSQFKVHDIYDGKLASPDFNTDPEAKYFKTMIRQNGYRNTDYAEENNKVNFAGHYTLIEWRKMGATQFIAIVDRINGRVYHKFPFGVFDWFQGIDYTKDSKMLVINSSLLELYPGYSLISDDANDWYSEQPAVYIWNDSVFKKVQ